MNNLKQKILPPSSASFHHFETIVSGYLQRAEYSNKNILTKIDELNEKIEILQKQVNLYSEVLLKNGAEESSFETRVKLFRNLPKATGQLRYCQESTSRLMLSLNKILRNNGIEYWFGYGSLLGAYTRNGPIPWDDDVDICMHRDGFIKLLKILKNSDDFQITIIYDWYVKCVQYRFCSKDVNLPSFIDIGIWDYATDYTEEKDNRLRELRLNLMDELAKAKLPYWEEQKLLLDPSSGYNITTIQLVRPDRQDKKAAKSEVSIITKLLQKYIKTAYDEGIFCEKRKATSYAYSFDNLYMPGRRMLYKKDIIHPTISIPYEDFEVSCPRNIKEFLDTCYSNWPYIPNDSSLINGGHIDNSIFENRDVKLSMKNFLSK